MGNLGALQLNPSLCQVNPPDWFAGDKVRILPQSLSCGRLAGQAGSVQATIKAFNVTVGEGEGALQTVTAALGEPTPAAVVA